MKFQSFLAIALLAVVGCGSAEKKSEEAPDAVVTVEVVPAVRKDIRNMLTVQGSFVPSQGQSAKLAPQVAGRILDVYVKEGESVTQGQLLAKVDVRVQSSQQVSAVAATQAAQAQTTQSSLSYQAMVGDQAASLRSSQLALEAAQLDRDTQVNQDGIALQSAIADAAHTRSQSDQEVIQAQVARDHAQADYDRDQKLAAEGFVSQRDMDAAKATLATSVSAVRAADAARTTDNRSAALKVSGAREALTAARSLGAKRIAQAQAALDQVKAAQANVSAKRQEIVANQSLAKQKAADQATAAASTSLGEIRAPFSGKVVRRALNAGDFADTTTSVLEMVGQGSKPDFQGSVPAEDAAKIKPGMTGLVGDESGRVTSVSPADPQTGLCNVRVIGNFSGTVGSFASAQIVLSLDRQVTAVPKVTLLDREGKSVVYKVAGETAKMIEVKTIAEDGDLVEVTGVKPGDSLVKLGQFELSDNAKIKLAGKDDDEKGAKDDKGAKPDKPDADEKAAKPDKEAGG